MSIQFKKDSINNNQINKISDHSILRDKNHNMKHVDKMKIKLIVVK